MRNKVILLVLGISISIMFESTSLAVTEEVNLVTDIYPGSIGSGPGSLTVFDDVMYFGARTPGTGTELLRFDSNTVSIVADINPGSESSSPGDLTVYNGELYFTARGASGSRQLYEFDGNSVSPAPDSSASQNPQEFFVFDGNIYFRATKFDVYGTELWKYDGNNQTVIDIVPGPGHSGPKHFVEFQGNLYFNAISQLWRYNGTVATLVDANVNPEWPVVFEGQLYFSSYNSVYGRELWRYDGINPSERITDINPDSNSSNPSGMMVYNGAIYFNADNGEDGCELWRYDGNVAEMVANINPTPFVPDIDPVHHSNPHDLTVYKGVLYLSADDGTHGQELWRYGGTQVSMVADIYPGQFWSDPMGLTSFGSTGYFSADDGVVGSELWSLEPCLSVLAPNGGENLVSGSTYSIYWASEDYVNDVVIEFSTDSGFDWTEVTPPNAGNNGSYQWLVPSENSDDCLVRISNANDPNAFDVSDDMFTIFQCQGPLVGDLNGDCYVDFLDFAMLAEQWLRCGNPFDIACVE